MIINSAQEMHQFGISLAKEHKVLLLEWDLGSGKTTLAKWFAEWLGIDPNIVQSPTYTYINKYQQKLIHVDMRRIKEENELIEKGILDQIDQFDYVVIERPKFTEKLWINGLNIKIKKSSPNTRELEIS